MANPSITITLDTAPLAQALRDLGEAFIAAAERIENAPPLKEWLGPPSPTEES